MCADLGLEEDVEMLFGEMRRSAKGLWQQPDSFSFTAMINMHGSGEKPDRSLEIFDEMLERRVEPNMMGSTCLIQCLGKARRIDDAVRVFNIAMERGVKCEDRICGCLLSLVALCGYVQGGSVLGEGEPMVSWICGDVGQEIDVMFGHGGDEGSLLWK